MIYDNACRRIYVNDLEKVPNLKCWCCMNELCNIYYYSSPSAYPGVQETQA